MAKRKNAQDELPGVEPFSTSKGQHTPFPESNAAQLEMFRSLAEHSHDFIGMCDLELAIFYVNEAGRRQVGLSSLEEACAVKVKDYFFPEDQQYLAENFFPQVLREGSAEVEIRFRHFKTGGPLWVTCNVFKLLNSGGRLSGYATISRDITERRRAEAARRESEQFFRLMFTDSSVGKAQADPTTGRFMSVNGALCRITGYSEQELLQRSFDDITHPEEREEARERLRKLESGSVGSYTSEKRYVRPDGTVVWAEVTVNLVRDSAGRPLRSLAVIQDVTARKHAEEKLRESEERFRSLADGTPVLIWVHDARGGLRFVNRAWSEFFGKTMEQAIGEHWKPLVHPEDYRGYIDEFSRCHAEQREFHAQARVQRSDGQWRWVESFGAPRFSRAGEYLGMAGSSVDISTRKEAEAVLARDKEQLEKLVAERTAALRELVGELEHFSYSITHDMRAPLRAMMGFAEVAKELSTADQQEQKMFLDRIQTAAKRMDLLITDALNYSKAVRSELPLAPVDLGQLLRGMVNTYPELQSAQGGIQIEPELPLVMGNEAGLTQCFSNLLENAVKFAKGGEPVSIRVWGEAPRHSRPANGESWVRIWVEDQGIGIRSVMLPRVFDMFTRGSNEHAGTGIGLALVRKVVQRMGGRVGVESQEGRGSRFWVELKSGEVRQRDSCIRE